MPKKPINPPLLVIVGETASGKTSLAVALAQRFNGEVICADSRTVYKGMDIGTAKPTKSEQMGIPHYGLDIVMPDQKYSAALFKDYAQGLIGDMTSRGVLPILVGGTGLYIDAVLFDYQFRSAPDAIERRKLEALSVGQLQSALRQQGITLPTNAQNPRHLIRALETKGAVPQKQPLRPRTLILGTRLERTVLRQRIITRVDAMVDAGFIDEVRRLSRTYGWDCQALQAPGYRAFRSYVQGGLDLQQAKELFVQADYDLAKRQRTWFKRNKSIHWLVTDDTLAESVDLTTTFLNK